MILRIHTNRDTIDVTTAANISMKEILEQMEEGSLVLIETIYGSTFIINCQNINAIEILQTNINIPPISN